MSLEFRTEGDDPGFTVVDHIEGRRFPLSTRSPVSLEASSADPFRDPVDAAVSCSATALSLPYVVPVLVRDATGDLVAECHEFADRKLPPGEYELEVSAPIKLFVRATGGVTVSSTTDEMRLAFETDDPIAVGARSYHERPAETVTTTADPEDLMAAVSTFGSALKTTSPERSFPSLRGHPPAIELGDELDVPDAVAPPDTGLRIELPRDRTAVYAAATLAHYLGARLVPGDEPRLVADGEVLRPLDGPDGLEGSLTRILEQVFLLDCVVRTVGRYPVDLHAGRELADRLTPSLEALYDAPIADRVASYLEWPYESIAELVPEWYLSTHLSPALESATVLPYAANALAITRVERGESTAPDPTPPAGYESFVRSTRSRSESADPSSDPSYVSVSETDTIERAWFGDRRAIGANDLHPAGIRNRIDAESTGGPIDIAVVCTDERMLAEIGEGALYGNRHELPFDVTVHEGLTRDEFRALLATDLDYLHYVGHVDEEGIVCTDGVLDVRDLETVGVDTFLLNGCRSYDQGEAMIERGSVGGIVTHGAVDDANATDVGRTVAGLLDAGFSLRSALRVVDRVQSVEGHYTVVGDGGVQVAQSESGTPTLIDVARGDDGYAVSITTYPALGTAMGSCYTPYAPSVDRYFLAGGDLPTITLSLPEVTSLLSLERVPAIVGGEFRWSTDVTPDDLPP